MEYPARSVQYIYFIFK